FVRRRGAVALKSSYGVVHAQTCINGLVEARLRGLKIGEWQVGEADSFFRRFADQVANQVMSRPLRNSAADEEFHQRGGVEMPFVQLGRNSFAVQACAGNQRSGQFQAELDGVKRVEDRLF